MHFFWRRVYMIWIIKTDRQTDRKRCIWWAHHAICTGGLKNLGWNNIVNFWCDPLRDISFSFASNFINSSPSCNLPIHTKTFKKRMHTILNFLNIFNWLRMCQGVRPFFSPKIVNFLVFCVKMHQLGHFHTAKKQCPAMYSTARIVLPAIHEYTPDTNS